MTRPEMVQSKNYDKPKSEIVLEEEKPRSFGSKVGIAEVLDEGLENSKPSGKSEVSNYNKPDPPNVIRYQKFYPNFASSVQDFRGLQMFPQMEYAFSNFQPRTTEKGILEPSPMYETSHYNSDQFKCDNPCLMGRVPVDYNPRNYGMRNFSQNSCMQRHFAERSTGKFGAYTIPRKSNHLQKLINVPHDRKERGNAKQICDTKSPFKIAQSEHFSLLNSQKMSYGNAMHFTNHPLGAFQLIQSIPRAYISESQAMPKKEFSACIRPEFDESKFDAKPSTGKQLFPLNPYRTMMFPFEVNESNSSQKQLHRSFFEKEREIGFSSLSGKTSEWPGKAINEVQTRKNEGDIRNVSDCT